MILLIFVVIYAGFNTEEKKRFYNVLNIKKWFRPTRKPYKVNRWWESDPKTLKGKSLCQARGHDWQYFDEGPLLGKCKREGCGVEILR